MRDTKIWARLLDVENTVIEQVDAEETEPDDEDGEAVGETEWIRVNGRE